MDAADSSDDGGSTVTKFGADTARIHRPAQPVNLHLYTFLASNESRFVTGEVYSAAGGNSLL